MVMNPGQIKQQPIEQKYFIDVVSEPLLGKTIEPKAFRVHCGRYGISRQFTGRIIRALIAKGVITVSDGGRALTFQKAEVLPQ